MRVGVHRKLIARVKILRCVFWVLGLLPAGQRCPSLAGIRDERRRVAEVIVRIQRAAGFVDDALHVGK